MKHFLTLFITALLAMTASGAANVGIGSQPVLAALTNGQYFVLTVGNASNSAVRLVQAGTVSNQWAAGKMLGASNANQFGASTTITIKNGALVTNLNARGLTIPSVTASRVAMIDSNGNFTNVTSGSPSTEYVKADGTTGTPSGSGSTNVVTMEIGRANITNGMVMTGAGSAGLDLVSGTSAKTFSISVPDSLTASSTNKFDFNSPTAGQVIAVHSSSANVTVWTNAAAASGGGGYVLHGWVPLAGLSPADSTTYYASDTQNGLTTTYSDARVVIPKTGTIKGYWCYVRMNGDDTAGETVNHYLRLNDTTDFGNGTMAYNQLRKFLAVTGLSQAVTAGDTLALKVVTPAWTDPNPISVQIQWYVLIE